MYPTLTINRQSNGIGRQAAGTDYFSGYVHYFPAAYTLPSGFLSNPIQQLNSITDLVALGVSGNSSDETKSTGTWLCTTAGVAGETVSLVFTDPITGVVTNLGTAIVPATPTTTTTATALKNAINALSFQTNFTATSATATVTFTPPSGYGASLNTGTPYSIVYSSSPTVAGTLTQNVVAGVGSQYDVLFYHVREFFRVQGIFTGQAQGQLWLMCANISASPSTYANFTEVNTLQTSTAGKIKQIGVYANTSAFATSHVDALQAVATTLQGNNMPLSIVYQGDFSATTDLTTLPILRALNDKNVSVVIGQDGANVGFKLYKSLGKSIGMLGTTLGGLALAKVNESLEWRQKFNMQDVLEYTTLAWANGALLSASGSGLVGLQSAIDLKGYIFFLNEIGLDGAYFNDDNTCISSSSDYAYIADNRTIDKATRLLRANILPALGSPLTYNADGTLNAATIAYFEELGNTALNQMVSNGEISAGSTTVNPTQNVQATQNLIIKMLIVQSGVARNITVNIGYTQYL